MTEHTTAMFDSIDRRQFLRAGAGVAGTAAALPTFAGTAAAHFPEKLNIDITPKSDKNRIVLGSGGMITVAILQTDGFDPTSKQVHYRFGAPDAVENGGGARPAGSAQLKDINGDGKIDLILEFPVAETGFDGNEKKGKLVWERGHKGSDHGLAGTVPVTVIGGKQPTAATASTANPATMTETTREPTTITTTGAASTVTDTEPMTATGNSTGASAESTATAKATTTTAQGPGFGMLTALGGIGSIAAYLFTRYTDSK